MNIFHIIFCAFKLFCKEYLSTLQLEKKILTVKINSVKRAHLLIQCFLFVLFPWFLFCFPAYTGSRTL